MTQDDHIDHLIELDPSETGCGFPAPDQTARMAQHWEARNRPTMRRDWGRDLLDALRPVLWLLVAVFFALVAMNIWTNFEAASAIAPWNG